MLTGRLPYGAEIAKARTKSQQRKLRYDSALDDSREIPAWIDVVLKKAVHLDPNKRYEELSEFTYNLRNPSKNDLNAGFTPLIERNPSLFWKSLSAILALIILFLLFRLNGTGR
jgi:ribosomal protein L39E